MNDDTFYGLKTDRPRAFNTNTPLMIHDCRPPPPGAPKLRHADPEAWWGGPRVLRADLYPVQLGQARVVWCSCLAARLLISRCRCVLGCCWGALFQCCVLLALVRCAFCVVRCASLCVAERLWGGVPQHHGAARFCAVRVVAAHMPRSDSDLCFALYGDELNINCGRMF